MIISAILIFKFDRDEIVEANFFFPWTTPRKNLSIFPIESSCSWMLHRNKLLFLSSTEIRLFQVTRAIYFSIPFFDSRKRSVFIYIGFRYRYQIMVSCTKYFHIDAPEHQIFLFLQCNGEREKGSLVS